MQTFLIARAQVFTQSFITYACKHSVRVRIDCLCASVRACVSNLHVCVSQYKDKVWANLARMGSKHRKNCLFHRHLSLLSQHPTT